MASLVDNPFEIYPETRQKLAGLVARSISLDSAKVDR
jgi:hypothetical protein